MQLNDLPNGAHATVTRITRTAQEVDPAALRRLAELGFIPGEPVQMMRRGPGGREPLAVRVGDTLFGLRLLEAQCIEVEPVSAEVAPAEPASTAQVIPMKSRSDVAPAPTLAERASGTQD